MSEDKIKTHERLATLETKVEAIMTNHLPHIQKAIDKLARETKESINALGTKFWWLITLLIANLLAVVITNIDKT